MVIGFKDQFVDKILSGIKIHTIRKNDILPLRWVEGRKMHMATGVRTKKYNNFNTTVCTGTQKIIIIPMYHDVFVDNVLLGCSEMHRLILNDGFVCSADFFAWFSKVSKGKNYEAEIIHWTNYRY